MKVKFLFKSTLFLFLAALMIGLAQTAAAAPPDKWHNRSSGMGATAGWSSCVSAPAPNQVCTDTYIDVNEFVYRSGGNRSSGTEMYFNESSYMFDDAGNFIFLGYRYGYGPASLTITKKLTNASASATLWLVSCSYDEFGNETCVDAGNASINASWVGQGALSQDRYSYSYSSAGFTARGQFRGSWRNATATGSVDGQGLGSSYWANMHNNRSQDFTISR